MLIVLPVTSLQNGTEGIIRTGSTFCDRCIAAYKALVELSSARWL